jgi:hypothetical protein
MVILPSRVGGAAAEGMMIPQKPNPVNAAAAAEFAKRDAVTRHT